MTRRHDVTILVTHARPAAMPQREGHKGRTVHIITWKRCKEFADRYPDAINALRAWRSVVENSRFANPAELKAQFGTASLIGDYRTVFNIAGNKYRLVVDVRYDLGRVYVRSVLTHEEYDKVDVTKL